jgi:hypothetical protein
MGIAILDALAAVKVALCPIGPSFDDEKALHQTDVAERYAFVFYEANVEGPRYPGGNPRSFHSDQWKLYVHCWGRDKEHSFRMRQALITTLRTALCGPEYEVGRTTFRGGEGITVNGFVCIVELTIWTEHFEASISTEGEITDRIFPTTRAINAEFISAGSTQGDGKLGTLED